MEEMPRARSGARAQRFCPQSLRVHQPGSSLNPALLGFYGDFIIYIFKINLFIYLFILFLAVLGVWCCVRGFSSCSEPGLLFVAVRGLLIVVASLVAEHGL